MATIIVSKNTTGTYANTGYTGVEDTKFRGLNTTTNYSTDTTFATTSWDVAGGDWETSALKFDISTVGAGTVSNAEIGFYLDNGNNAAASGVSLFALLVDFVNNQATATIRKTSTNWNTLGGRGSGTDRESSAFITAARPATSGAWVVFSGSAVTQQVQDWLDGTLTNNGLIAELEAHDTPTFFTFQSYVSSEGTNGNRPYLKFDHTASGGAYTLDCNSGAFTLAGQQASLNRNRNLDANAGSFALAGQAAELLKSKSIVAVEGAFTIDGQQAEIVYTPNAAAYTLDANAGAFSLNGQQATLLKSYVLDANAGSFSLSGQQAELARGRVLDANAGAFSVTGQEAALLKSSVIDANAGAFDLIGRSATITWSGETPPIAVDAQVVSLLTYSKLGAK